MSEINQDEINALLAAEIRKHGLNDVIKLDVVREKVMQEIQKMNQGINEMENPAISQGPAQFPEPKEYEEQYSPAPGVQQPKQAEPQQKIGMEAGSQPLGVEQQPRIAIAPEVPDFLKDVEPEKIFIYDFNELSVGGENLSNKPFKTLSDPNISKSMQQMWSENGVTRAEVYQTKFEKIGEVVFDYKSGQSQFIEKRFDPDFQAQQQYKENPYMGEPTKEIENYVKNYVDIDQKVSDVITNIVKNYFLTNSERAINDTSYSELNNVPQEEMPYPTDKAQIGVNRAIQEEKITISDLIHKFNKVDTPNELIETIQGKKSNAKLVYEDKEIKKWLLGGKEYFLPSNPMSIRKCYTK